MDKVLTTQIIKTAAGLQKAGLLLKNARILDVFTGVFFSGDIALCGAYIAGVGSYDNAEEILDLHGRFVVPGFINAHCHVESSMVTPAAYCSAELRHGTTTLITDPHEIANVAGADGIRYMLRSASGVPVNYYVQLPSCVPATAFEHSGASLGSAELASLFDMPGILGLGEMMNYPGVLACEPEVLAKLSLASGRVIDGHAPSLSGLELQAYAASGIMTDHECEDIGEALEKLRSGIAILVREGSAAKNLEAIISGVLRDKADTRRMAFCSDDKHILQLQKEGTIRHCIRKAIALGLPPATAYTMASYNAACIYRLYELGAVAAGYKADLVVLDDLSEAAIYKVYKDGKAITCEKYSSGTLPENSVHIAEPAPDCFSLPHKDTYPAIRIQKGRITTEKVWHSHNDAITGLTDGTLCKLAVIERHHSSGNMGLALLEGYGLRQGAVATTVAHDSHNLIVAGTNDDDMLLAVSEIKKMHGGFVYVRDGKTIGTVPLPIYGLMSAETPERLTERLAALSSELRAAGVPEDIDPFITLSFLALPVIPEIRVTDMGVFDVLAFKLLD